MSRDLFGFDDPKGRAPKGQVQVALHLHKTGNAAWLLSDTGKLEEAKWLPFSLGERGVGVEENVWTMAGWKARENGWE